MCDTTNTQTNVIHLLMVCDWWTIIYNTFNNHTYYTLLRTFVMILNLYHIAVDVLVVLSYIMWSC